MFYLKIVSNSRVHFTSVPGIETMMLSLYDLSGKLLLKKTHRNVTRGQMLTIDLKDIADGVYQLIIESDNYRQLEKVVVIK